MSYLPILAVISPIIVILVSGLWLNRSLEKLKSRLQKNQAIVQKRVNIYTGIQEHINSIYCYIKRVGDWKEFKPTEIIEFKRNADKIFYATRPFWSKEMRKAYEDFMNTCFLTNRGHKLDASIIAEVEKYTKLESWNEEFRSCYNDNFDESKLEKANDNLMEALSKDFGVD